MSLQTPLFVERISDWKGTTLPERKTPGAAGYDLHSIETKTIAPRGGRALFRTGIALRIPDFCYGQIAPRSSLALNHGIDVGAGIIDSDYRGEIKILLFNHGEQEYAVRAGDRIAQLIIHWVATPPVIAVESLTNVDSQWNAAYDTTQPNKRGINGFGSTGV